MAETGGKGNKKKGRWVKKPTNKSYKEQHRREKNKLKRVLKSSGSKAAYAYAVKNSLRFTPPEPKYVKKPRS
jgi:hypothetical protein